MIYLHAQSPAVLHLNLKSANVLLDDHGVAKVHAPPPLACVPPSPPRTR